MKPTLAAQAAALLALAVTPSDAAEFSVRVHSNLENRGIESLSAATDSTACKARAHTSVALVTVLY